MGSGVNTKLFKCPRNIPFFAAVIDHQRNNTRQRQMFFLLQALMPQMHHAGQQIEGHLRLRVTLVLKQ